MIKSGRILVLTLIAVLAIAVSAAFQWGVQEAKAEVTAADITISLKNSDVPLKGAQYDSQTIDSIDCFEFDYIDGMRLTLAAYVPPALGTYASITVKERGDNTVISAITESGIYSLTVTVSYNDDGVPKQTDKHVDITINKLTLDIDFDVTERYYKDNVSGAVAYYLAKPVSVGTSSLKYAYYEDENLTMPLSGVPEDAGEYYVKAYYENPNNTNFEGEKVSSFVIHPSTAVIEAQSAEIKYSGSAINIAAALNAAVVGECSADFVAEIDSGEGYTAAETISAAGNYRVRFHFEGGDANFVEPYSEEYDLTISKADIRFEMPPIEVVWSGAVFDLSGMLGSSIRLFNSDYETEINSGYGAISFSYFNASSNPIGAPVAVGEYRVQVACAATDNYNAAESDMIEYSIVKRDIIIDIAGDFDASSDILTAEYNENGVEVTYSLQDGDGDSLTESTDSETKYYALVSGNNYEELNNLPVTPGEYRVEIQAESEHYYGAKILTLIINKVMFAGVIGVKLNDVDFVSGSSFPYTALEVALEPYVAASYDIDGFTVEFEGIAPTIYPRTANKPRHAGTYRMFIALSDELYEGETSVGFTVTKLTVTVKPKDITAVYGDRIYIVSGSLIYRAEDVTVQGLAVGDTAASIVDYIRILIGNGDSTQTDATFTPRSYTLTTALKPNSAHPSYIIDVGGSGTGMLTVTKRLLTVSVNDITVAVGGTIAPSIKDITGFAYSDASNNLIRSSLSFEFYKDDEPLESVPNTVGRYSIKATGTFDNYTINAVEGTLTICNPSIADSNALPFSAEGKFAPDETLKIEYGGVTEDIKSAIGSKLSDYTAIRVYNVVDKAETADGSGLKVIFDISDLPESKNYKVLAKYGTAYTEVDFSLSGNNVVISEITMADAYILCDIKKIDYMWFIFAGAIILIIGIAVGVVIRLYLTGGFKKKYKNESKTVVARASAKRIDDFDEIEQAIASFDESTVVREMTPAERLEQKRKEEQYEQYRLKLQRLRSTGDKTLEDSLIKSGIKNVNDDMIIEMMIAEDEERMRRIEEEARLEKEAQEREKEKPKAVILPKSTESYEQKSFAPKPKDDDDFDIDI